MSSTGNAELESEREGAGLPVFISRRNCGTAASRALEPGLCTCDGGRLRAETCSGFWIGPVFGTEEREAPMSRKKARHGVPGFGQKNSMGQDLRPAPLQRAARA